MPLPIPHIGTVNEITPRVKVINPNAQHSGAGNVRAGPVQFPASLQNMFPDSNTASNLVRQPLSIPVVAMTQVSEANASKESSVTPIVINRNQHFPQLLPLSPVPVIAEEHEATFKLRDGPHAIPMVSSAQHHHGTLAPVRSQENASKGTNFTAIDFNCDQDFRKPVNIPLLRTACEDYGTAYNYQHDIPLIPNISRTPQLPRTHVETHHAEELRTLLPMPKIPNLTSKDPIPPAPNTLTHPINLAADECGILRGAKVPNTVREQGVKITYADFISILRANGHDKMKGQFTNAAVSEEILPVVENDYHRKVMMEAVEAERNAGISWDVIKGTQLVIDSEETTYPNPYDWRGWFTRGDMKDWVEPLRRSTIEAGGWDYECLLEWEKQEQAEGPTKLLDWIKHKSPQDWDSVQRGWLYIQLKDLLDQPPIREETAIKYTQLFWPDDWSKATPYNCFWLRFPDCSPLMPWRQYGTMTMITEWYKMNKRKIATYKSRMTSLKISETAAGRLMKKPERSDNDVVNKLLNGPKRPRGYRAYTNTPEFRDLMAVEIAKRMKAIQEEQGDPHLDFRTQEKFKLREAFKHKAWKELPASEKAKWENIASQKAQSDVDNMTNDEITLAFHRHMVRHFHQVADRSKIYMVVYAAMSYEGKEWVTFTEAGQSPIGTSITTGPWRSAHDAMIEATMDAASRRGDVERRDVEYVQLIGPDAALWAEESDPDMDEDGNLQSANAVTLPELPFTASTKVGKSLAKKIRDWMKESLSRIHGINYWKLNDWKRFQEQPDRFFLNLPQNAKQETLSLRNFEQLDNREIETWRDHLIASMATPPRTPRPFTFKMPNGTIPKLTTLQPLTQSGELTNLRRKRSRKDKDSGKKKVKKSRRGKDKKVEETDDEPSSSSSESSTESDEPRVQTIRRPSARLAAKITQGAPIMQADPEIPDPSRNARDVQPAKQTLPSAKRSLPGSNAEQVRKRAKHLVLARSGDEGDDLKGGDVPLKGNTQGEAPASASRISQQTPPAGATGNAPLISSQHTPDPHKHPVEVIQNLLKSSTTFTASDSRSFTFQTKGMGGIHSSLPAEWAKFGYDQIQIGNDLRDFSNPLHFQINPALTAALDKLPPLYGGILRQASSNASSPTVDLLEIFSSLHLLRASLMEYQRRFSAPLEQVLPLESRLEASPILKTAVSQLMYLKGPLPGPLIVDTPVLVDLLSVWIQNSLRVHSRKRALTSGDIPSKNFLQLLRTTYFIFSQGPPEDFGSILTSTVNVLGSIAIHRYGRLVLQKISTTLLHELSHIDHDRYIIVIVIAELIRSWNTYCESRLPLALANDEYILSANHFPSIAINQDEADALLYPLAKQPWWSGDLSHFPLLIEAPRTQLLQEVLGKIPVEDAWNDWNFLDKFAAVITCIAASIPYLNDWRGTWTPSATWSSERISEERASMLLTPQIKKITGRLVDETGVLEKEQLPTVPDQEEYAIPQLLNSSASTKEVAESSKAREMSSNDINPNETEVQPTSNILTGNDPHLQGQEISGEMQGKGDSEQPYNDVDHNQAELQSTSNIATSEHSQLQELDVGGGRQLQEKNAERECELAADKGQDSATLMAVDDGEWKASAAEGLEQAEPVSTPEGANEQERGSAQVAMDEMEDESSQRPLLALDKSGNEAPGTSGENSSGLPLKPQEAMVEAISDGATDMNDTEAVLSDPTPTADKERGSQSDSQSSQKKTKRPRAVQPSDRS